MTLKLWSTFRISPDTNYNSRYAAMVKAFEEVGTNFWTEQTSFFAFDTKYTIDAVALHVKKAIDASVDLIIIRQIDSANMRYIGVLEKPTEFFSHFPDAKKF